MARARRFAYYDRLSAEQKATYRKSDAIAEVTLPAVAELKPLVLVLEEALAHAQIVKFRTFLRTVIHELIHHLDVTIFAMEDSFHTQGFFRRESSLVRSLLGASKPGPSQLPLFG